MKEKIITDQSRAKFAQTVKGIVAAKTDPKLRLVPFKNGIARLRRYGTSFETIAEALRDAGVTVSTPTVADYCRELEQTSPRGPKPPRKSAAANPPGTPSTPPVTKPATATSETAD